MAKGCFKYTIFILCLLIIKGYAERTKDKMYSRLSGASCIRRLNPTHQTGCTSAERGSVGALHAVNTPEELSWVLNTGPSPPYIPIITPFMFTLDIINQLKAHTPKRIAALLLVSNRSEINSFSQESKCPNQYSGLANVKEQYCDPNDSSKYWNPFGSNLLHEDLPFPVLFVTDDKEILKIYDCFEKFNNFDLENQNSRSLCSAELDTFMAGAVSSEVCFRRSNLLTSLTSVTYCDPLGGKNLFSTLFPRSVSKYEENPTTKEYENDFKMNSDLEYQVESNDVSKTNANRNALDEEIMKSKNSLKDEKERDKYIVVIARMDSTSMFSGVAPGAMDSLVALTTILSTMHILSRVLGNSTKHYDTNILFTILYGETYDYIGSQRMVYDMQRDLFPPRITQTEPITLDQIDMLVEIGTLGATLVSHFPEEPAGENKISGFLKKMQDYSDQHQFNVAMTNKPRSLKALPPSSIQTFLDTNPHIPALVFTDYEQHFTNRFYNSPYDDADNIRYRYYNQSDSIPTDGYELEPFDQLGDFAADSVQMLVRNVSSMLSMSLYEEITGVKYPVAVGGSAYIIDELIYCYLQNANCPLFRSVSEPGTPTAPNEPPSRYTGVDGYYSDVTAWTTYVLAFLGGIAQNLTEKNCTGGLCKDVILIIVQGVVEEAEGFENKISQ